MAEMEQQAEPVAAEHQPGALQRLEEANKYLRDRIDLLYLRLEAVLGADFPSEAGMIDPEPASPFEGMVAETHRGASRIDHLLSRLVL